MPPDGFNSLGKQTVRDLWNTPLLRYLHEAYGVSYRYVGLPGARLHDILLWRDMISEIIAFENDSAEIEELRLRLRELKIPNRSYRGELEKVVIRGRDMDGARYDQGGVVTLYNLDFCGQLATRLDTRDPIVKAYRFEVISYIFEQQRRYCEKNGQSGLFLMFVTVRDEIHAPQLRKLLSRRETEDTTGYVALCREVRATNGNSNLKPCTWGIKSILHSYVRRYLVEHDYFSSIAFPFVKYTGSSAASPMVHWMIMCTYNPEVRRTHEPDDFLTTETSVRAADTGALVWEPEPGEPERVGESPDAKAFLQEREQWLRQALAVECA